MNGIILTAGRAESTLTQLFGDIPASMVPVNGRPLLHYIIQSFTDSGITDIFVNVDYKAELIERYLKTNPYSGARIRLVKTDCSLPPGNSILDALKVVTDAPACIILGDTLIPNLAEITDCRENIVFTYPSPVDTKRWCMVYADTRGHIETLIDKVTGISGGAAAVGLYVLQHPKKILALFENLGQSPIEISEIIRRCIKEEVVFSRPIREKWLDFGHLDNFQTSKKRLLEARSFNNLDFDDLMGTITKRSKHLEKFKKEIAWQVDLPKKLKVLSPRIIDYNIESDTPFLTMEYYGYPSIAELWVYAGFDDNIYKSILHKLMRILLEFKKEAHPVSREDYALMYTEKTEDRVAYLQKTNPVFKNLLQFENVIINGKPLKNWKVLRNNILEKIPGLYNENDNCLIHGDFCFSNVLFNMESGVVRLLDPRGIWGSSKYGDIKYDIAKLRHSVSGLYDFIVNDSFECKVDENVLNFRIFFSEKHIATAAYFDTLIAEQFDLQQIKLIEGLLFLSMIPYHENNQKRQYLMFARAIELLNEVAENKYGAV
jgi:dTDP-glucose pyrophosphorylase